MPQDDIPEPSKAARELKRALDKGGEEPSPRKSMPLWAIVIFVLVGLGMLVSTFQAIGLLPAR